MRGTVHRQGDPRSSPPAAIPVDVTVVATEIVATSDAGERFVIPLAEVSVEAGGFDGEHVFLRNPGATLTIATDDPAIVTALEAHADERMRALLVSVGLHRKRHSRLRSLGIGAAVFAVVGVVLGVGVALFVAPRLLAGSIEALPISIDRQLGDAASGELDSQGPAVEDPVVVGFIEEVVMRLEPHAATPGFEYRIRVVESAQVNAFALPGGQIVVFTGLIREAERPEQVAGVLAHEISHVTLRHGMRNLAHQAGLFVAASILFGDASGWVELAADAAILAQSNDYSRDQESAADEEGVRMLMAAGLDPTGLADFFRTLADQPGSELSGAMSWLSTHPDHASRIAHVEELARTLPAAPRRPLSVDWDAVQRAVADR